MKYQILIFDQIPVVRIALKEILENKYPNSELYIAKDFHELHSYFQAVKYDLIIIDINNRGVEEFSILKNIKQIQKHTPILVFSSFNDLAFKVRCFKFGINGFIIKNANELEILKAINLVLKGESHFSKEVKIKATMKKLKAHKLISYSIDTLSSREFEIASMIASGWSNRNISLKLNIATTTVSTYKKRILLKTNTKNSIELAFFFKEVTNI